jgi:hypothetical protein
VTDAEEAIHNRIHGEGYCEPPCGLCLEVADLIDAHKDDVIARMQAAMPGATQMKASYLNGWKAAMRAAERKS